MARIRARSALLLPLVALVVLLLSGGAMAEDLEVSALDGWTTVEGAKVKVKDSKGDVKKEGTTKRDGEKSPKVEFDGLDPGTYTVEVEYTDDNGTKKTGKKKITIKKGKEAKVAVNVDEKKTAAGAAILFPTLTQAALSNVSYQGGIEQGDQGLLTRSGYQVASDGTKKCRHGDGAPTPTSYDNLKTGGPVYSTGPDLTGPDLTGPELAAPNDPGAAEALGAILGSKPRGDDPRDTKPPEERKPETPAFYGQVKAKMKCKDGATGQVMAKRRLKLVDPALGNPQLALNDANKNDNLSGAGPLQCTTDSKGRCEIHGVPVRDKAKGETSMEVLTSDVRSFTGIVIGARVLDLTHQFGRKLTADFNIGGTSWVTLSGSPDDAAAINKGAQSAGIKLQENKCRKTKPGLLAENLDSFPVRPAHVVPRAHLSLNPEGGR